MADVLIYGAGAIGSFVGYLLSELGTSPVENVALLGRKGHIQRIREAGLKINIPGKQITLPFRYCFSSLDELDESNFRPDLVIICVKTYSLSGVRDEILRSGALVKSLKNARFCLLMNGMGNKEKFDPSSEDVYEGITSIGAKFFEDGQIELKGWGKTIFESRIPQQIQVFLRARFEEKGLEIEFSPDFKGQQWNKLFINAANNPITALTRMKNEVVISERLKKTVEEVIEECVSVAEKEGYPADKESVLKLVRSIVSINSENISSMLQDVLKGKRTEIDSINGYVVNMAKKHGLHVPVNEALYALVKSMEIEKQPNETCS
ncbi:MAG TPA: 2-dehydropantoate 2-reductase [Methanotrichaceae archaeon]|nr:2-dehydropantoate 2-reductase [Methanotrichaceae archaeon]